MGSTIYNDKLIIGNKILPSKQKDCYDCKNGVLYQFINKGSFEYTLLRYDSNSFAEDKFRYEDKEYFSPQQYCSYESEEIDDEKVNVKISFWDKGKEILFQFISNEEYEICIYDFINEVLVLKSSYSHNSLLFYTKTGERLWEYKVAEGREIHEDAVVVVDDIVVITCKNEKNKIVSVEGYILLTGEKVWEADDVEHCRKSYSQGLNKMLYGLTSFICKDHTVEMRLTQLNPFTGEVEMNVIKEGEYWSEVWPWNTTIHGNKLFYTNLIEKQGCSFGVIDLETKELIEDFPMESQGNQIEKPLVTDDKIYVRVKGLNELRIYENEFK
ncbi:MAG: hypothetical protein K6E14_10430 [Paludibacteraceae bacterium]|nr:hypothetical protein [Paludibacteraceae bacterium]